MAAPVVSAVVGWKMCGANGEPLHAHCLQVHSRYVCHHTCRRQEIGRSIKLARAVSLRRCKRVIGTLVVHRCSIALLG